MKEIHAVFAIKKRRNAKIISADGRFYKRILIVGKIGREEQHLTHVEFYM